MNLLEETLNTIIDPLLPSVYSICSAGRALSFMHMFGMADDIFSARYERRHLPGLGIGGQRG